VLLPHQFSIASMPSVPILARVDDDVILMSLWRRHDVADGIEFEPMRGGPMDTSTYVDGLLSDLASIAAVGEGPVTEAAERLAEALRGPAALRLLDLLAEAAVEVSAQLPSGHVEIRLAGAQPSFVYVDEEQGPPPAGMSATADPEGMNARISLRLPGGLKESIERAASAEHVSANTWIVRELGRAASRGTRPRHGRRLTGYAQG
jgi:hypothetical protein